MTRCLPSTLRPTFWLVALLAAATLSSGCQRGEKSCRYYSLVLERSEDPSERKNAIEEIKRMSTADQLKCDDDKVFARFTKIIEEDAKYRSSVVEALDSVGKASEKLRERSQVLLAKALGFDDAVPVAANIVRQWRVEAHEAGKEWFPDKTVTDALGAALRRVKDGEMKATLLESLWLSLQDDKARAPYVDLLVELADTDPSQQTVMVNIRALKYLTSMRVKTDAAFNAYLHGLFLKDAANAEIYGAARLALAVIPKEKVLPKILGMFEQKDEDFKKWAKDVGLFEWEWQEGPKLAQILQDLHDPSTAQALVTRAAKAIDASEEGTPKTFGIVKRGFPWGSYITSRLQLTMWAIASMGEGAGEVAEAIGTLAATQGPTVEQRTMPFIGLSISGSSKAWPAMLKAFETISPQERADFMTPMSYAVEPENLGDWERVIVADKSEGTQTALADPTIVGRLKVVTACKEQMDAAADQNAKLMALGACYAGFLKTGDNIAKEKAAIGLVHLLAKGVDTIPALLQGYEKTSPTDSTIRQVMWCGFRAAAETRHIPMLYKVQQEQVQIPNNQTWDWEFDILLNHLATRVEQAKAGEGGAAAPAAAPAEGAPAEGGAQE